MNHFFFFQNYKGDATLNVDNLKILGCPSSTTFLVKNDGKLVLRFYI